MTATCRWVTALAPLSHTLPSARDLQILISTKHPDIGPTTRSSALDAHVIVAKFGSRTEQRYVRISTRLCPLDRTEPTSVCGTPPSVPPPPPPPLKDHETQRGFDSSNSNPPRKTAIHCFSGPHLRYATQRDILGEKREKVKQVRRRRERTADISNCTQS